MPLRTADFKSALYTNFNTSASRAALSGGDERTLPFLSICLSETGSRPTYVSLDGRTAAGFHDRHP